MRLDFENFDIGGVANTEETTGGECATDKLAITVSYIDVHFKSCTRCKTLYATHPTDILLIISTLNNI